jgi:methylated-DNA-[protein]-cysteine S-methyltransferase
MMLEEVILTEYGALAVCHDGKVINSINFLGELPARPGIPKSGIVKELEKELQEFAKGKREKFSIKFLPLPEGTVFQEKVWKITSRIPYGKTLTYKDVAEKIGNPKLARAVGNAMRANRLPFLIPCHRVVAQKGLGGYAGTSGIATKRKLLLLERAI